jgi:hypothetical protein
VGDGFIPGQANGSGEGFGGANDDRFVLGHSSINIKESVRYKGIGSVERFPQTHYCSGTAQFQFECPRCSNRRLKTLGNLWFH